MLLTVTGHTELSQGPETDSVTDGHHPAVWEVDRQGRSRHLPWGQGTGSGRGSPMEASATGQRNRLDTVRAM